MRSEREVLNTTLTLSIFEQRGPFVFRMHASQSLSDFLVAVAVLSIVVSVAADLPLVCGTVHHCHVTLALVCFIISQTLTARFTLVTFSSTPSLPPMSARQHSLLK